jgi:nitrate/nitrite transporter NarK
MPAFPAVFNGIAALAGQVGGVQTAAAISDEGLTDTGMVLFFAFLIIISICLLALLYFILKESASRSRALSQADGERYIV